MLDIKFIRENPQKVKEACEKKQVKVDVDALLAYDGEIRGLKTVLEAHRARKNKLGKDDMQEAAKLKEAIKEGEPKLKQFEERFNELLKKIPNIPFDDVPVGKDDSQNIELYKEGKMSKFVFTPKEHFEIGEGLNIIDIERGAKVAGSRFYFLKNEAVILETALIQLVLSKLVKKGFVPVIPPVMIRPKLAEKMGYIENHPDEESYYLERDNLYLTATSEQSLGAMHAGENLDLTKPKKYVAFSTCFRRESGSYGKDTKGIFRVHQFDKMEMFVFCKPEDSEKEHRNLLAIEEELMKELQIPYRVVNICTGDLGKPAARKYDIEAWMPGQSRYRETHSTSNCTDYQARGLEIKYKNKRMNLISCIP
jgi:seryl-tRNA synthetase